MIYAVSGKKGATVVLPPTWVGHFITALLQVY